MSIQDSPITPKQFLGIVDEYLNKDKSTTKETTKSKIRDLVQAKPQLLKTLKDEEDKYRKTSENTGRLWKWLYGDDALVKANEINNLKNEFFKVNPEKIKASKPDVQKIQDKQKLELINNSTGAQLKKLFENLKLEDANRLFEMNIPQEKFSKIKDSFMPNKEYSIEEIKQNIQLSVEKWTGSELKKLKAGDFKKLFDAEMSPEKLSIIKFDDTKIYTKKQIKEEVNKWNGSALTALFQKPLTVEDVERLFKVKIPGEKTAIVKELAFNDNDDYDLGRIQREIRSEIPYAKVLSSKKEESISPISSPGGAGPTPRLSPKEETAKLLAERRRIEIEGEFQQSRVIQQPGVVSKKQPRPPPPLQTKEDTPYSSAANTSEVAVGSKSPTEFDKINAQITQYDHLSKEVLGSLNYDYESTNRITLPVRQKAEVIGRFNSLQAMLKEKSPTTNPRNTEVRLEARDFRQAVIDMAKADSTSKYGERLKKIREFESRIKGQFDLFKQIPGPTIKKSEIQSEIAKLKKEISDELSAFIDTLPKDNPNPLEKEMKRLFEHIKDKQIGELDALNIMLTKVK